MKKKALLFSLLLFTCLGASRLYFRLTDDFRPGNILSDVSYNKEWNASPLSNEDQNKLLTILNQEFHYLGKGAQSYALLSDDGKYILKLFKAKHLKQSSLVKLLPSFGALKDYKERDYRKKEERLSVVLSGYHTAFELHREETGLLFIHMNNEKNLHQSVTIKDKMGFTWSIDLDPLVFIVQKKTEKCSTMIKQELDRGELSLAKAQIVKVLKMRIGEYQKGIYDSDHGLLHNFGFIDETPIHYDVGKLKKDSLMKNPEVYEKELDQIMIRLSSWLKELYPEYQEEIISNVEASLEPHTLCSPAL